MKLLSIEGGIGSGKSTVIEALKKEHSEDIIFVPEPIHEWNTIKDATGKTMLQKFYDSKEEYSFPFQMMAYISRLSLLTSAAEANPGAIIVTERSLDTDRYVFAKMLSDDGFIEDVNMQIYLKWFDYFLKDIHVEHIIYIDATPEKCLERIKTRARPGEEHISVEYLSRCDGYYKDMVKRYPTENVFLIDGNIDYDPEGTILKNRLSDILQFCNTVKSL